VINLMPPVLKEEISYGKMNRVAMAYLRVAVLVVVVLTGLFAGTYYLIQKQIGQISTDVASKESELAQDKKTILPPAQDASERLNAINYVQTSQTRFSALISDLTKLMPVGVKLQGISLTGSDKTPVTITVLAGSYDSVLATRDSLATSPRLAAVDIVSITSASSTTTTAWNGTLVLAFKPGQAK
jgi:Tfp pilus assembly protein PilN